MQCIRFEKWQAIDAAHYQAQKPYPYLNIMDLLYDDALQALNASTPDISLFKKCYDQQRAYGQQPHNRYNLEYSPDLPLSEAWLCFLRELTSAEYCEKLAVLMGVPKILIRFHWHYQLQGDSVCPHCDEENKLGTHLFYLNPEADWHTDWGGQTLILNDYGKIDPHSAPELEQLDCVAASKPNGNSSLLFTNKPHGWHAVKSLRCPKGAMRKMLLVVFYDQQKLAS